MKLPKISPTGFTIIVLVSILLLGVLGAILAQRAYPLDQYVVSRQCDFIEFADLSAASCTDGTSWLVSPLQP